MSGNRCGHNPFQPNLAPAHPIPKGKGGLPRILSLAAERIKEWYYHPQKCHVLKKGKRQTRSERREAYQRALNVILYHLDLASMCLGTPTLDNGFVDISMKTLVDESGMSQRRCERVIGDFREAGLMEVKQPRKINEHGDYVGLRAIRVVKEALFEFLGLGPMLRRERAKASERLRRRAQKANRKLADMMRRLSKSMKRAMKRSPLSPSEQIQREDNSRRWNQACVKYLHEDLPIDELRRRVNAELGFPPDYSPGYA